MSLEPTRIKKTLHVPGEDEKKEPQQNLADQPTGEPNPKAKHHRFFVYPPRPKPNPALAPFFEKLNEVKDKLNNDELLRNF